MEDSVGKEVEDITFEEAMTQLEDIIKNLEDGKMQLDDAINAFERGMKLKQTCETKLNQAKLKIDNVLSANKEP